MAHKLVSTELHLNAKLLYVAEKACWDTYTYEIENARTPSDAVQYSLRRSRGGWAGSEHSCKTFESACCDPAWLKVMEIPMGESSLATKTVMLSWPIVSMRSWSLTKHDCPPESYAGILGRDPALRARVAADLRTERNTLSGHWGNAVMIARMRSSSGKTSSSCNIQRSE